MRQSKRSDSQPERMVPTRSKAPIIASTEAAGSGAMPKSPHRAMKWVWIRPLVLSPQIKKVPNSTQNTRFLSAPRSSRSGSRKDIGATPAAGGASTEVSAWAPKGRRPRSRGWSRTSSHTSAATSRQHSTTGISAQRQPTTSISQVARGRNNNWPVATLAVSMPSTRPRRCSNQRLATTAPSTRAISPEPRPSSTPHSRIRCQTSLICVDRPSPPATDSSAPAIIGRSPKRSINRAENGPISPNSTKRIASAVEICSVFQPNSSPRGRRNAPGKPSAAEAESMVRKVTPAITQA